MLMVNKTFDISIPGNQYSDLNLIWILKQTVSQPILFKVIRIEDIEGLCLFFPLWQTGLIGWLEI